MTAVQGDYPAPLISDPDAEGWQTVTAGREECFITLFGPMRIRGLDDRRAVVRVDTHAGFSNILGAVHGGFLLGLMDQVLFMGPTASGLNLVGGVTIDVSAQFLAPARIGPMLEAETEILRETKRLTFVRGLIRQDGEAKLAFTGTVRKPSA